MVEMSAQGTPEESGAETTLSYADGQVVKFLPTMDVVMSNTKRAPAGKEADIPRDKVDQSAVESSRLVTKHGTVIRYFPNNNIEMLFANGNVSTYSAKTNTWIKTKNDGSRLEIRMKEAPTNWKAVAAIIPLPTLSIETKTDPESNCEIEV